MISRYIEFHIHCDICGRDGWTDPIRKADYSSSTVQGDFSTKPICRKQAKIEGWVYKNRQDICPLCISKQTENKNNG